MIAFVRTEPEGRVSEADGVKPTLLTIRGARGNKKGGVGSGHGVGFDFLTFPASEKAQATYRATFGTQWINAFPVHQQYTFVHAGPDPMPGKASPRAEQTRRPAPVNPASTVPFHPSPFHSSKFCRSSISLSLVYRCRNPIHVPQKV